MEKARNGEIPKQNKNANDQISSDFIGINRKTAAETNVAISKAFKSLPPAYLVTLTFDNEKEFAWHEHMTNAFGIDIYFARPYHSWERGLNENTNTHPSVPAQGHRFRLPHARAGPQHLWTDSTIGPENVLTSRFQISYSPESNHRLHLRVESVIQNINS